MTEQPTSDELARLAPDQIISSVLGADDEQFLAMLTGEQFSFSVALMAVERGFTVARLAWKNPGKYVFYTGTVEFIQPSYEADERGTTQPFLMWKNDKGLFSPWFPSQDAVLAKDWFLGRSGDWGKPFPAAEPIQN